MPPLPVFTGTVSGGRLTLDEEERFKNYVRSLDGRVVDLTLGKHREKRSLNQNAFYWTCFVSVVARHYNCEPEELHDYWKRKYNPKLVVIDGKEVIVGRSTTELDRAEFTKMLEQIRADYAAEGFTFPHEDRVEIGS